MARPEDRPRFVYRILRSGSAQMDIAAGSYTLTIGSSSALTDVAGNALSPTSVTVSFR